MSDKKKDNPRIVLEIRNDSQLAVSANLNPDMDMEVLAHLLLGLQRGNYAAVLNSALVNASKEAGCEDAILPIITFLSANIGSTNTLKSRAIVPPRQAIRLNMKASVV